MTKENDAIRRPPPGGEERNPEEQFNAEEHIARVKGIFDSRLLRMMSRASGGFDMDFDESLDHIGHTNLKTRKITMNPLFIPNFSDSGIRGFSFHESGHHNPRVVEFQDAMAEDLTNHDIIPERYRGHSEALETRFYNSLHRHVHNALADIFLEAYMGRPPHRSIEANFQDMYSEIGSPEGRKLHGMAKPSQLMQLLVGEARYSPHLDMSELVDSEVYESYEKIVRLGALREMMNVANFHNFSSPQDIRVGVQRKFRAYSEIILPEYLKLLDLEIDERTEKIKQALQNMKQGSGGMETQSGGEGGGSSIDDVPLTPEEISMVEEILKELEEQGKQFESQAPSDADQEREKKFREEVRDSVKNRERTKKSREGTQSSETDERINRTADLMDQAADKTRQDTLRGLADAYRVRQESIETWHDIVEKRSSDIEYLADRIAEIFVDDRRRKMDFPRREGMIMDGLEYEHIAGVLSGEADPQTQMVEIQNPSFIEVELENIADLSGSMAGEPLKLCQEMAVVLCQAFMKARETLEGEDLVLENEDPLKIGLTTYSVRATRVSELSEPITEEKQIKIVDALSYHGGGTDEVQALTDVYEGLRLKNPDILRIMVLLTDGYGNREGVASLIRRIEEEKEVLLLALSFGLDESGVEESYRDILESSDENVTAATFQDPSDALPFVMEFFIRELQKMRKPL